jgi:AcrR family transcriptional regulator
MLQAVARSASQSRLSPRERILEAARDLFYRLGIRAVGVDSIAEAAGTNKMTLYRHFSSKDELVAEYLRGLATAELAGWDALATEHPGAPKAQLIAWLRHVGAMAAQPSGRGCALANAAVELAEKEHPARAVIERHKNGVRNRLVSLCREAGANQPDLLADELFLLLEGAHMSRQSVGLKGPGCRFVQLGESLIEARTQ